MSKYLRLFLCAFVLYGKTTFGQTNLKLWDVNFKLEWGDFAAEADTGHFGAWIVTGIKYRYHQTSQGEFKITFEVEAYMTRTLSYVKRGHETNSLLKHEQLHFDIAEFFARKLLKLFNDYPFTVNFKEEIVTLYFQNNKEKKEMEHRYDIETEHSGIVIKQNRWNKYISMLLNDEVTDYTP